LWSHAYDGTRATYLDLVRRSTSDIRFVLLPATAAAAAATPASAAAGSDAELVYQRGMYHLNRYNNLRQPADLEQAETAFRRTLELDPARADAAAEIGLLALWSSSFSIEAIPGIEEWARRALAIDPRCSRAWTVLEFL